MKNSSTPSPASRADLDEDLCNFEEVSAFNGRGLFLGGCPKSGTTLLLALLDGHPNLVVLPEETHFLEERKKYQALKNYPAKLRRLLEESDLRVLGHGRVESLREGGSANTRDYTALDHARFARLAGEFTSQPWMNDSILFSEVVRAYAIAKGCNWRNCTRWVEKTTRNEACSNDLFKLFPGAKLLQVVRDPRAVFASRKRRLTNRYGSYAKAHRLVREWNQSSRQIEKLRNRSDHYLMIRYEDLVQNTREVMGRVSQFIGVEFLPVLFEPTRAGKQWQGNSSFYDAFSGVSSQSVDQWKSELTEDEIWWVEMHCREGMRIAGYQTSTNSGFSFARWFKRLPGESWGGYLRARRASLCQWVGLLEECQYQTRLAQVPTAADSR